LVRNDIHRHGRELGVRIRRRALMRGRLTFRSAFFAFLAALLAAGVLWILFVMIAGRDVFDESEIRTGEITVVPPPRR
jgi:hypothetical protein